MSQLTQYGFPIDEAQPTLSKAEMPPKNDQIWSYMKVKPEELAQMPAKAAVQEIKNGIAGMAQELVPGGPSNAEASQYGEMAESNKISSVTDFIMNKPYIKNLMNKGYLDMQKFAQEGMAKFSAQQQQQAGVPATQRPEGMEQYGF